jgi:hypothetical protein
MRVVAAIAGLVTLAAVVGGAPAYGSRAATVPTGGSIYIHATGNEGPVGSIIITGAIGDYGRTVSIDRNGKTDNNGNFVKITLKKGTFEVDSTTLNAKTNHAQPMINKGTCSFRFSGTAPVTLFNGTGLYTGIKGKVLITISFGAVGSVYKSGPHKGQCNMSESSPPLAQYASITGPGTVTFS